MKNEFIFVDTVYPRVHPTETIVVVMVLRFFRKYSDDSEASYKIRPFFIKAIDYLNKQDYIGALGVMDDARQNLGC